MCILSERREMLNQNAPLAKKIASAYHTLDEIRGGCPMNHGVNELEAIRHRIYREIEQEYMMDDIEQHVREEGHDLHGLTPGEVMADNEMIDQIAYRFGKCDSGEEYWFNMEYAVEEGIKEVFEKREVKKNG